MDGYLDKFLHQKRVTAHRPGWPRMLVRRFFLQPLLDDGLKGYVSLLFMERVSAPLVRWINGEKTILADDGYSWLQYYLDGQDFSAVATFNAENRLVQWYIDVISNNGVTEEGLPWYDDLYLDVVATPEGWVEIIDGEDLDLALMNGAIDQSLHDQAWTTARRLAENFRRSEFRLSERAIQDRDLLLKTSPRMVGNW